MRLLPHACFGVGSFVGRSVWKAAIIYVKWSQLYYMRAEEVACRNAINWSKSFVLRGSLNRQRAICKLVPQDHTALVPGAMMLLFFCFCSFRKLFVFVNRFFTYNVYEREITCLGRGKDIVGFQALWIRFHVHGCRNVSFRRDDMFRKT